MPISAVTGEGIDELKWALAKRVQPVEVATSKNCQVSAIPAPSLYHRAFFYFQILVQHRRRYRFRIEIEGERALLVEASQQQLAAAGHLLRCGGAKHLFHIFWPCLRNRIHLRLRHGDEEQHMAPQQMHSAVDDFGTHGGLGQIRNPENQ